jgi:two-component system NtrC family sensor kinase
MRSWISYKLILVVAAVSVTIIGVFSFLLTSSHHEAAILQVERNAHQLSETIKSGTKHDMLLNLPEGLQNEIDTIGRQDGIEQIRIFNKDGVITYSSDRTVVGSSVNKQAEACYGCHAADRPIEKLPMAERTRIFSRGDGHRTLGIINPIYNEPACWQAACHAHQPSQKVLGVLDVDMSLAAVDQEMKANRRKVVIFTATAVLAISVIIWLFIENLVGKPVGRLVEATKKVAAGDLTTKLDVRRKDELGHLADSFNAMTVRLAEVQQQLYQSDKLASLGRLAAGVAHEINNPLTGVLTYSSFLLKRAEDGSSDKEDLEIIVRETKRCRQIVKGLLDFSRQVPAKKTHVALDEVVSKSLTIVHNRLSFDKISVRKQIPPDLPRLMADDNQLTQVFINLLVNAADAIGGKGGEIVISARPSREREDGMVEINVVDTGCGIPAEEVSKVFEPFYSTKANEGTGLGLAVVWGIVDKHGGTIKLDSQLNRGTTVTMCLPSAVPARTSVAQSA